MHTTEHRLRSRALLLSPLLVMLAAVQACGSSHASATAGTNGVGGASNGSSTSGASMSTTSTSDTTAGNTTASGTSASTTSGSTASSAGTGGAAPASDAGVDAQFLGDGAGAPRTFTVINRCASKVWAAALPATTFPGQIVEMEPGYAFEVGVDNGWSGRIWGKTECTTSNGKTTCASDPLPASLAELTLTKTPATGGLDFYDVSLVDGFNLPIQIVAVGHTPNPAHPYDCGDPSCAPNLNATCPQVLQDLVGGVVLACANDECKVLGNNVPTNPNCIYPNQYTEFFKTACPTAYSYPSDDPTSTFTCKGLNDYEVVFCP
jgi:hypothetical protein